MDMIQLLVAQTNKHYNRHLDTCNNDGRDALLPDVTVQEMDSFWPQ